MFLGKEPFREATMKSFKNLRKECLLIKLEDWSSKTYSLRD